MLVVTREFHSTESSGTIQLSKVSRWIFQNCVRTRKGLGRGLFQNFFTWTEQIHSLLGKKIRQRASQPANPAQQTPFTENFSFRVRRYTQV